MEAILNYTPVMAEEQRRNIAKIIGDYSKRLMGFIRNRVPTEADAEDILQDVFYQLAGNTQPIEQLTAWLFRVARNRIIDVQRKRKPELLDDIFGDHVNDEMLGWKELLSNLNDTPENTFLRNLFWETLHIALDELPTEQKDVFVWNELEGIPFKEISEKTGASVNTLLSRKRYAMLHLRKRLQVLKNELLNY